MKINRFDLLKFCIIILMVSVFVIMPEVELSSQCPMCRIAAESNLQNGGTEGRGLNTGILYMLSMPYLLVLILGFIWYRNRKLSAEDPSDKV